VKINKIVEESKLVQKPKQVLKKAPTDIAHVPLKNIDNQ
jgi:hypothetical protein